MNNTENDGDIYEGLSMEFSETMGLSVGSSQAFAESSLSMNRSSLHRHVMSHNKNLASTDDCSEDFYEDAPSISQSNQSSSNDTGFSPTTTNEESRQSKNVSEASYKIGEYENLAVMTWRLVMFVLFYFTSIGSGILVYFTVYRGEKSGFETAFEIDSVKIYKSLGHSMDTKLKAADSLAMMMVDSAKRSNQTWPYTTFPNFASKAAKMRMMTNAIAIQEYVWVEEEQRSDWEDFAKANEEWVYEAIEIGRHDTTLPFDTETHQDYDGSNFSQSIRYSGPVPNNTGPYTPSWYTYPMLATGEYTAYNVNAIQQQMLGPGIQKVVEDHQAVIGPALNFEDSMEEIDTNRVTLWAARHSAPDVDPTEPVIQILYPILDTAEGAITVSYNYSKVVGIIASSFYVRSFLEDILPSGERGLVVVFQNTCNQTFTYEINGDKTDWLGPGDHHESNFDNLGHSKSLGQIGFHAAGAGTYGGLEIDTEYCAYTVSTYPSTTIFDIRHTNKPIWYTMIAVSIFLFTAIFFVCYDKLVSVRQKKVMKTAVQSTNIVSSLFPSNVRHRLLDVSGNNRADANQLHQTMFQPTKTRLRTFLNDGEPSNDSNNPIADLFTDTTVLFADIAGFTAWSSVREPCQVFTLLETVYSAFDNIAARRGVFKVETIGDSYVAVTGLPDPRKDHAVVMAKFARDCREQFNELCSALESTLGPETGELKLRIGFHSGPVTAGVLRGQKSRFQLFGDTVNTAARMESTGKVNKIQVSQKTANLLKAARKSHWLHAREEMVEAKGKGFMVTYWVEPKTEVATSTCASSELEISVRADVLEESQLPPRLSNPTVRLINWNIDVLERLLKKIIARHVSLNRRSGVKVNWKRIKRDSDSSDEKIVLDEVQEVITLPEYDSKYSDLSADSIVLDPRVRFQLREFVTAIAMTYHSNPFHNFSHASHVGMSVAKLLSRIVAPDIDLEGHEQLHDHTYGITSDPLTQFACVFSALIHDADHPGVPNKQLVKEGSDIANVYEGKSIAEQNSINIAWNILLEDKYKDFRKTICRSQSEASRFRQLVINAVCATDIIDKDLKAARNKRWEKAFSNEGPTPMAEVSIYGEISSFDKRIQESRKRKIRIDQTNRKATIVIEHIIQASDVAHTMQHWHIYVKWNERLYAEMYKAYTQGRAEEDPTGSWYKGELGFFDFYVIPLAQKLSECGVFGVSSDEYLNYAIMNRNEWEKKGQDVVAGYVNKYGRTFCGGL